VPLLANAAALDGCKVVVDAVLRIDGSPVLFLSREDAEDFRQASGVRLQLPSIDTQPPVAVLPDGSHLALPVPPTDAIVEGTVRVTEAGEPELREITRLSIFKK
jgi:hypothetical protein